MLTGMRWFKAVLGDALREHRDRKANYVLLAASAFATLAIGSLRFRVATPQETVDAWTVVLPATGTDYKPDFVTRRPLTPVPGPVRVERMPAGGEIWRFTLRYPDPGVIPLTMVLWEESDKGRRRTGELPRRRFDHGLVKRAVEVLGEAPRFFPETASEAESLRDRLDDLARRWRASERRAYPEPSAEAQEAYQRERWSSFGFSDVSARRVSPGVFEIALGVPRPREAVHVQAVEVLWLYDYPVDEIFSDAHVLMAIQAGLHGLLCGADWSVYLGGGIFAALLVTGGTLTTRLAKGAVELDLSRPVSRSGLLLARYASGCLFVFFHAAVFVLGTAVALYGRTGFWNPGFLAAAPLAAGIFASLYAPAVLVSVISRSVAFPPAAGILVGFLAGQLAEQHRVSLLTLAEEIPGALEAAARVLFWTFPKTAALIDVGRAGLGAGVVSDALARRLALMAPGDISQGAAVATTALFTAATLALACWLFSRKEP